MSDETAFNPATGRKFKITIFSKKYAKANGHHRYFIALFERGQLISKNGWYETNLSRARKDGRAFLSTFAGE